MGIICLELKQYNQAQNYYSKALQIRPNYSSALTNLGWVEYLNNKVNIAIEHTVKAHAINPEDPVSNYNLGLYYLKIQNLNKADLHYNAAMKISPADPYAYKDLIEASKIEPDNKNYDVILNRYFKKFAHHEEIEVQASPKAQ